MKTKYMKLSYSPFACTEKENVFPSNVSTKPGIHATYVVIDINVIFMEEGIASILITKIKAS